MSYKNSSPGKEVTHKEDTLPLEFLQRVGVSSDDMLEVVELSKQLDSKNTLSVAFFGQEAAETTVSYADRMLEMVNTKDLDDAGTGLALVLNKAKEINTSGFAINRSRIPLVGTLVDKFRVRYSSAMLQFSTARDAIDKTAEQVKETQINLEQRIKDLDEAFDHIRTEYRMLGKYIAAGELAAINTSKEIKALSDDSGNAQTPLSSQNISDQRSFLEQIQKRVTDLTVLQQNAINTLPAIRLVQSNNAMLIDKYNTIITLTLPVWKRSMMLGLSLEEQAQSVELANNIDDFTNELLRKQANLLKQNTLATAKANQRLVIDVETLNHVQSTLIATVTEVKVIQDKAEKERNIAIDKIMSLRKELGNRLAGSATDLIEDRADKEH